MPPAADSWLSEAAFVSTLQPSRAQRRVALTVALLSLFVFVALSPFAKLPLGHVMGFLPAYQSALVIFDLVTAALLLSQYGMLRNWSLPLLAAGYVFSAVMAAAHALSFPGLFAAQGVIGSGSQTTAWLYFLWHGGFPLFVAGYAIARRYPRLPLERGAGSGVGLTLALGGGAALLAALVATAFGDRLPVIMNGDWDEPRKLVVAGISWLMVLVALAMLWRARTHTVLDLWLMVMLCVWAADTGLAAVLNGGRFDLGWYAGRVYGLLANGFVLAVLLLESAALYARLARAMAELQLAHRDLQAFSGSLAHDLQQPITTITAFAQVIQAQAGKLTPAHASHLEKIVASAQTAHRMIAALLEFARLGAAPVKKESVELDRIVAEARNVVTRGDDERRIEWDIEPLPTVDADASLMLMAFINLLSNAVKYTRGRDHAKITVRARQEAGGRYAIEVRDNGVGFDMAQAKRLFAPFERLHHASEFEGTGMGLANVRRIMEKHGGSVRAQAEPGRGAAFTIVFA
jgi:signal transduction histidine kinase